MKISGLTGLLATNAYNTGTKRNTSADAGFLLDSGKEKNSSSLIKNPANSADPAQKRLSQPVGFATANTLWEAQSIAQSRQSAAIDVEPEEAVAKPKSDGDKFIEFMNKSPEEMMRDSVMKDLGYTEEEFASLSSEERSRVEMKIQDMIQKKIDEAMREDGVAIDGANRTAENLQAQTAAK